MKHGSKWLSYHQCARMIPKCMGIRGVTFRWDYGYWILFWKFLHENVEIRFSMSRWKVYTTQTTPFCIQNYKVKITNSKKKIMNSNIHTWFDDLDLIF